MFAAALRARVMADVPVTRDEPDRPEGDPAPALPVYDWSLIVDGIRDGDQRAMESLYRVFSKGVRFFLLRNLGPEELEDRVHDCFVVVIEAIQNGELREPERLMGYVRTVVKRQIASTIDTAVHQRQRRADFEDTLFCVSDWRENPERGVIVRQRKEIARRVLAGISARDRDILNRFYVLEQSQDQICADLGLSYNQFRLLKSRAKARFGELGRRLAKGAGINLKNIH